jgi:hypothetical protein
MHENQLIKKCKELNELQVEITLFHELNSLNQEKLLELESRFDHQNIFKPVNFMSSYWKIIWNAKQSKQLI